ncbi:5-formyltetrahydrofolate cyclo-ligase [Blochmannia endosymbiont of Camponotus sp. C-046]|uniref:5-formyltetrahydrofolate cyclo-ligase n=1 Tax=Blochmannia endosymbiont of Camponotus sp. C-046 TaxID=2945589 RepID=UPI002024B9C9|nr:5-formyltetrahydrofolate cyclo-ligase [Blochmannia endosymbiont of Camponotus sp. C-046]URJ29022.1 5-formyltetrahydrofolate cyclo-ligase [Blochmannia endosymbiont of Camponotus sp. C-046]
MYADDKKSYRKFLRMYIRKIRRTLTFQEQYIAAQLITNKIIIINHIHRSARIAMFIDCDGEINTSLLIRTLLLMHKQIYLPILTDSGSKYLEFARYTFSTPLICNHLNIYEPKWNTSSIMPIEKIDVIFVPLVAFDIGGNRLGMGGGFYDRTLKNWKHQGHYIPIGLAHDFQKIPTQLLPVETWDVILPEIITPSHHVIVDDY